jgi:hypothetical protein
MVYTYSEVIFMPPRGGHREGAGRPAEAGERRIIKSIKFAPIEWEEVKQKADKLGLTASEYIRKKALQD